jgi:hypothetical protein
MIDGALAALAFCAMIGAGGGNIYKDGINEGRVVCEGKTAVIRDRSDRVIARVEKRGRGIAVLHPDGRVRLEIR